jgi:thioester reductase-like protein
MKTILITGFPGFLGSALLPRLLGRASDTDALCLVQTKFANLARERLAALESEHPSLRGRVRLVAGDITRPGLDLEHPGVLQTSVREIYHLAAIYDLDVRRDVGMRINVDGTRNVLEFANGCSSLERFQYVSTCYVSGGHPGVFTERDLDVGQTFHNFYEETKYLAEVEVQQATEAGLPTTIYRPTIVVGDSRTGATQKYDGPYTALRLLLRQPRIALLPVIGDVSKTRMNVVPRDFVVDAIAHLSGIEGSRGLVYHLADPTPPTVGEIIDAMGVATRRQVIRVPLPLAPAKVALRYVPGLHGLLQIPAGALDYFVHPTSYATTNTEAGLAGTGIRVTPLAACLGPMAEFVRRHPEVQAEAMA